MGFEYPNPELVEDKGKYNKQVCAERIARSLQAHGRTAGDIVFVRICQDYGLSTVQEKDLSDLAVENYNEMITTLEREFVQAPA